MELAERVTQIKATDVIRISNEMSSRGLRGGICVLPGSGKPRNPVTEHSGVEGRALKFWNGGSTYLQSCRYSQLSVTQSQMLQGANARNPTLSLGFRGSCRSYNYVLPPIAPLPVAALGDRS